MDKIDIGKLRDISDARARIEKIFAEKGKLEDTIEELIAQFEDSSGLKIDKVFFRRVDTVRIADGIYTDLTLIVT